MLSPEGGFGEQTKSKGVMVSGIHPFSLFPLPHALTTHLPIVADVCFQGSNGEKTTVQEMFSHEHSEAVLSELNQQGPGMCDRPSSADPLGGRDTEGMWLCLTYLGIPCALPGQWLPQDGPSFSYSTNIYEAVEDLFFQVWSFKVVNNS